MPFGNVCAALGSDAVHKTLTVAGLKQIYGETTFATSFLVCEIYFAGVFLLLHCVMIAADFWCIILLGHLIFSMGSDTDDRKPMQI